MLKEVKNNVYNALFVAADEEGRTAYPGKQFLVCLPCNTGQDRCTLIKNKPRGKRPGAFLYPANASRLYILGTEKFCRYNPRAAMIGTRGGPFLRAWHIL